MNTYAEYGGHVTLFLIVIADDLAVLIFCELCLVPSLSLQNLVRYYSLFVMTDAHVGLNNISSAVVRSALHATRTRATRRRE